MAKRAALVALLSIVSCLLWALIVQPATVSSLLSVVDRITRGGKGTARVYAGVNPAREQQRRLAALQDNVLGTFISIDDGSTAGSIATPDDVSQLSFDLVVAGEDTHDALAVFGVGSQFSGSYTWTVTNNGQLPGQLKVVFKSPSFFENGCNEPERIVDATCAQPGRNQDELVDKIIIRTELYRNDTVVELGSFALNTESRATFNAIWRDFFNRLNRHLIQLYPGENLQFTIYWSIDPSDVTNAIQSDTAEFKLRFTLKEFS